jgi:short-subunit dehydrogenase
MSYVQQLAPGRALITGASSGMGASFARQLAALGCDLVLVARREDRLRQLASELERAHGHKVEVLAADLATLEGLTRVETRLATPDHFTLLINNAGFGSGGLFHEIDVAKQLAMIQVHVVAPTRLARAVLPQMTAQRRGAVINVASVAAYAAVPTSAMYSSTKAWMLSFSQALALELAPANVRVQALCPGFTTTGFHDTPEDQNFDRSVVPRFMWMTADAVVARSLAALERDRHVCIPGGFNQLMVALLRFPPGLAVARYLGRRRWRRQTPS